VKEVQTIKIPGSHKESQGGGRLGRHRRNSSFIKVAEDGTAQVAHTKKGANQTLHEKE
jgi:hypothetical protein